MRYTLEVTPIALAEIDEIANWYDGARAGVGTDFLLCIEDAMEKIQRHPDAYQIVFAEVRRKSIARFSYAIFFRISKKHIEVLGVIHHHRDPISWKKRI